MLFKGYLLFYTLHFKLNKKKYLTCILDVDITKLLGLDFISNYTSSIGQNANANFDNLYSDFSSYEV